MQVPKPIPVIRPLRFQEIPANAGTTLGGEQQSVASDDSAVSTKNQQEGEPTLSVFVPRTDVAP